ncbi:MAG: ATP synthase F0 subunit C [Armatimonadetes bacterium]|nr:ATP synthase F0 subunit C [Armatimonadota bacterium]
MIAVQGIALAIGIGIGFAVLGAGIGQGLAANGAMNGMARQPELAAKIQTGMIIALAFVESLVIFTLVLCFQLLGKLPATNEITPEQLGGSASFSQPAPDRVHANNLNPAEARN